MPDSESQRLANLYDQLREKLLDLSKKNRMLNYSLGARSKKHIQIVDEVLEIVCKKLAEQEMGLSTLFMAFGFVEWYDSDASEKKALAPLLLLPVKIEARNVRGHDVYLVSAREDQAEANLSLQKLLENNFKRQIPAFEALDEEGAASIEDY